VDDEAITAASATSADERIFTVRSVKIGEGLRYAVS
jgi:hypothetical protein